MKLKTLIRANRIFFIFLLFFFSTSLLRADEILQKREFDETIMQSYAESSDFAYMDLVIHPPSIWQRIKWWFQSVIGSLFSNANAPWIVNGLFYVILALVLAVAIFYIVRLKYGRAISADSQHYGTTITSLEGAKSEDFEAMIEGALKEENYKLAIRYIYLQSLTYLSQKGLIKLKDSKSPYDYERELKGEVVIHYRNLCRLFEYVWYGDFNAEKEDFDRSSDLANQMNSRG